MKGRLTKNCTAPVSIDRAFLSGNADSIELYDVPKWKKKKYIRIELFITIYVTSNNLALIPQAEKLRTHEREVFHWPVDSAVSWPSSLISITTFSQELPSRGCWDDSKIPEKSAVSELFLLNFFSLVPRLNLENIRFRNSVTDGGLFIRFSICDKSGFKTCEKKKNNYTKNWKKRFNFILFNFMMKQKIQTPSKMLFSDSWLSILNFGRWTSTCSSLPFSSFFRFRLRSLNTKSNQSLSLPSSGRMMNMLIEFSSLLLCKWNCGKLFQRLWVVAQIVIMLINL